MFPILQKLAQVRFTLFLLALTTVYLVAALQIKVQFDEGLAGPKFLPVVASVIMYAALLRILWRESRHNTPAAPLRAMLMPAQVVAATCLYVALFRPVGYAIATFLFVLGLFWVFEFERTRPARMAFWGVAVTLVFYLLFGIAFHIRLPVLPGAI